MTAEHSCLRLTSENGEGLPTETVEYMAFLARSEHRLHVLDLLANGTRSREELRERSEATRVTLSRILGDLEDRGLVRRRDTDRRYEVTAFGEVVHQDFARLLGTVSVGQRFPDLVSRLPTDWFDFDIGCLADGERVHGKSADPLAAARVVANALRDCTSCEALVGTFTALPMHAHEEDIRAGTEAAANIVFDAGVTETMLEDPSLRATWQRIEAATDETVYYSLDEQLPCTVDLIDDETVFLTVSRDQRADFDIISCSHPDVLGWAKRVVAEHRDRAVALSRRANGED